MHKIAFVFGTRPEAIKCAPVIRRMKEDSRFAPIIVSTGQHREMLDTTLAEFEIAPDIDLGVMQPRQTLSQVTHRIIEALSAQIDSLEADAVVVHGDTASTLAGALTAFQHRIPVIHIEAGLRSGNLVSPFPEEANRRLVGQITDLHLAPTVGSRANLIREGICESRVRVTGNTVVDALQWAAQNAPEFEASALSDLMTDRRRIIVASAHRRESWGDPMREIAFALAEIARDPDVRIILPLHRNLAVREVMVPALSGIENVTLIDPLPYRSFCRLMRRADVIISDSSGAEEEGPSLGKPTLVLRDITERPEAVEAGTAKLVGRDATRIVAEVRALLGDDARYREMAKPVDAYGDGNASERVIAAVSEFLSISSLAEDDLRLAS